MGLQIVFCIVLPWVGKKKGWRRVIKQRKKYWKERRPMQHAVQN